MKEQLQLDTPHDEGISSMIGVILLIVITVIIASVILTFSLGLTDQLREPPQAGVTFEESYNENGPDQPTYDITVVVSSQPNADQVTVDGPTTSHTLTDTGDHVTLKGLEKGDLVIATAQKGEQSVVVRRYRVGES
jgi:FlaG/FlaF family flagellin (archaellin)